MNEHFRQMTALERSPMIRDARAAHEGSLQINRSLK